MVRYLRAALALFAAYRSNNQATVDTALAELDAAVNAVITALTDRERAALDDRYPG